MKTTAIVSALLCAFSLFSFGQEFGKPYSAPTDPPGYTHAIWTTPNGYFTPIKKEEMEGNPDPKCLKPYASVGAGVSGNLNTYAAEVGLYNHSYWVAIVSEFTPDQGTTQVYLGPKFYKTLCDVTKESQLLVYGALKMHLNHIRDFAFEPGICYVYSFTDKWAIQISASSPIYEGQRLGNPTNLSGGLGVNYWIR